MLETKKINQKIKLKKKLVWLLEKIETDDERVLRIARKNIEQLKINND